jgi:hypothetical protein
VHGRNWEISNGCIILTADLMLVGTAGRLPGATPTPWMPLTSSPMTLNELGAPTGSGELVPANTITLPGGFNPGAPGTVWASLPTTGGDTFGPRREPATIVPPYGQTVRITATSRTGVVVTELAYSLVPLIETIIAASVTGALVTEVSAALPAAVITITAPAPDVTGSIVIPATVDVPAASINLDSVNTGPTVYGTAGVDGTIDVPRLELGIFANGQDVTGV